MNWNKVLNFFVGIFIVLNILIFGVSYYVEANKYTISDERKDLLEKVLYEKGYSIRSFLPDYYPKAVITLASQNHKKEMIVSNIIGDENYLVEEIEGIRIDYISDNESLSFLTKGENAGIVQYRANSSQYKPSKFTEEELIKVAKNFAKEITLSEGDFAVTYRDAIDIEKGTYSIEMSEIYEGEILYCNNVFIYFTKEGIESAVSRRFEPIKYGEDLKGIYPIDEVLYEFVDNKMDALSGIRSITSLEIGYDLDEDQDINGDNIRAIPYYSIKVENEPEELINAFTLK